MSDDASPHKRARVRAAGAGLWDRFHLGRPSSPPRSAAVPWGGRERTGALGRGPGTPASPRPRPRLGGSVRGQDALGFPLRPIRAPRAQRRHHQEPDPPGPGGRPQPPPRPLRPVPARGPALARLPQATLAAAGSFPHLPEGQTWGPLPGMADLAGKRRAAGGARTTAATSALPRGAAPARAPSLPPGRGPGAPSPGLHNSHPSRARTRLNRVAQPTCSLFWAAITTCPGSQGRRPPLASVLGRRRRRAISSSPSLLSSPLLPLERRLSNQHLLLEITEN